ncbi:sulfotransferase family 2 domain-containing protein [Paracoccus ravus]|uniref:sulfotransferase family 2 domain-containing protein n=1 Tax=Paracoccus ravus TaxID=2447760 RepID=UPI001431B677|nr:sulfotransferase family 2 domain-containing protein [Paracoccus ravus]
MHIPKCGGQSIETLFLEDLGLDWNSRAPLLLRSNKNPKLGPPRLAHLLAEEYLRFRYVSEDQFADYFKFSYIRDPYARVISLFNYLKLKMSLQRFVMEWLPQQFALAGEYGTYPHEFSGRYHFVRPQSDYIFDANGKLVIDKYYKLEEIKTNHKDILALLRSEAQLKHVNSSADKTASVTDLDEEMRGLIAELYDIDFKRLPYDKHGAAKAQKRSDLVTAESDTPRIDMVEELALETA